MPRSFTIASARPASPRAQIATLQPSCTSAAAMARPKPLLEPVTTAVLPSSSRFTTIRSAAAAAGQVVQRPVERRIDELEGVLLEHFLLDWQQLRHDERDDGAFDGSTAGEHRRRGGAERGGELALAPRED